MAVGCLAALLLVAPAAARADAAQVTVVSPGGQSQTLALDAMAGSEDVINRSYALRSSSGVSAQTITGFSIASLLDAAGADPYSFSYLELQRPAGGSVQLSRDQALDEGVFPDGPPVLYATAAGTGFLRPSGGEGDANATDSFEAPQGISIVLRKGEPLRVRAQASPLRTRTGEPVDFEAIVDRAGSGERLYFSWYFDDGHRASGDTARHSFAKRGSYDVVVSLKSDGDDAGTSDVVTIQVGAPPEGPDRKGGGTNDDTDAPDHGVADGPGSSGGVSDSPVVAPVAPPPEVQPTPESRQPTPPPEPDGELVSGELVSAETTPTPPAQQPAAARRGNPEEEGGDGGSVSTAAWGALATLGLLGLGALGEAGGLVAFRRGRWGAP